MPLRIAHFSDIHLTATRLRMSPRDWIGKSSTGWLNAKLGRGRHFQEASVVAATMVRDIKSRGFDQVIFSGDATTLGLSCEYDEVRRVLEPDSDWPPRLAVPGNHDYYTTRTVRRGEFERVFTSWQHGERIDEHVYPFVQRVGPILLIAVNSAQANRFVWDSRGRVGHNQQRRLLELMNRQPAGPRIMVTHYPLCLDNGLPERSWRRLRDAEEMRSLAANGGVRLWLHGHRHGSYFRNADDWLPFPVVCAGSATQAGKWSYNEYTFVGGQMHGRKRFWSPEKATFVDGDGFSIPFAMA